MPPDNDIATNAPIVVQNESEHLLKAEVSKSIANLFERSYTRCSLLEQRPQVFHSTLSKLSFC